MPAKTFEPYRKAIYQWAFRLLGSHHDALDTVQDVFIRWVMQAKRRVPKNPRSWLRKTTMNRAIDLIRSRRFFSLRLEEGTAVYQEERAELEELRADLAEGLKRLTESQRAVLTAKEYDGLTFTRIAEEMDVAVPTVKTHYLRALQSMRRSLAGRWKPERS
jgi:RNA polymerase sigma-70 factor (ECF subfamily)